MTSISKFVLLVEPVPASRPRVTRWGVYYGKRYTQFRKDAEAVLEGMELGEPIKTEVAVHLEFYCRLPKTTKRTAPRGDIDNYCKAVLDSCNGHLFVDDDQITKLTARKMFDDSDNPRIIVTIFTP